jgi:hypothetical protein
MAQISDLPETPHFPHWRADLTNVDNFGVDPHHVTLTLRTRLDKENVPDDLLDRVMEALRGAFDG